MVSSRPLPVLHVRKELLASGNEVKIHRLCLTFLSNAPRLQVAAVL